MCTALVGFYLIYILWAGVLGSFPGYFHRTTLDGDGRFHLLWSHYLANGVEWIRFRTEVQAHGYTGLGLSPNGGMRGSDIVTGWVKDGAVYFQDRHGIGNTLPPVDESEDWLLLYGRENDTHTTLEFERKLDTCDEQDMKIDNSTVRLIFAYTDSDPTGNELPYHDQRGSKSALLLQPEKLTKLDKSGLMHWDILSPKFQLSSERPTVYWCKIYKSPELYIKHHIVLVEPLIQKDHEEFVHHLLVYECVGGESEEYEPLVDHHGHACYQANMPHPMRKCEGVFLAWGVGGGDIVLPDHVGIPLDPSPSKYYMLEIHYDNPQLKSGITDESGLRIYYSPHLRKYDAGSLMVGSTVSTRLIIPQGMKNFVVAGHSSPDCLAPVMPKEGVKILGVFLHSHLLGRRLKARHFRNGVELLPLATDANYDFDYQDYRYFTTEVALLPNDQITIECSYDSTKRDKTTFGGISTQDEMCLAFLLHYPRLERYASLSVPSVSSINEILINPLQKQNLTLQDVQKGTLYSMLQNETWDRVDPENVGELLRKSPHSVHCYLGNGKKNSVRSSITYPSPLQVYEESSTCIKEQFQNYSMNGCQIISCKTIHLIITFFACFMHLSKPVIR